MKHFLFSLSAFLLVTCSTLSAADAQKGPDKKDDPVVAVVNSHEIRRAELDAAAGPILSQLEMRGRPVPAEQMTQFESDVLEELIARRLLLDEAAKLPVTDLDEKVKAHVESLKRQMGSDEAFAKALASANLTEEQFLQNTRENLMIRYVTNRVIEKEITITDQDLKDYYEGNPGEFDQPESVKASHILILVPADANDQVKKEKLDKITDIRARLVKGESFADIARENSEDPGSAARGGDLGYFQKGMMVPEFEKAAFTLPTNKVSEVVTTQYGHHLILVTDQKAARKLVFNEVKEQLAEFLRSRKAPETVRKHISDLRQAGTVKVLLKVPTTETAPKSAPESK